MPGQTRGARRPGQRQAPRGDATAKTNERLRAENAAELADRADELAMLQEVPEPYDAETTDLTPEALAKSPRKAVDESELEDITPVGSGGPVIRAHPRQRRRSLLVEGVGGGDPDQMVTVKLNGDYPEVTLGAGVHVDFEEGRPYDVPRWVAQHFEEKDMLASVG